MPENSDEEENQKYKRPCSGVKQDLIDCLMSTDCVQKVIYNYAFD